MLGMSFQRVDVPLHHLPPRRQLALKAPAGVCWAGAGELVDGHAHGAGVVGVFEALAAVVGDGL